MQWQSNIVRKVLDAVEKVVMVAAVISLGVIVLTVVWQVVARYVTSQSTAWAPELSQTAFVWTALLAIPLGVRSGRHMLVDIWRSRPERLQKTMFTVASLVVLVICGTLVVHGVEMLGTSFQRSLPSLGISSGWQMLAVPVGFGLSFLFQLEVLVRRFVAPRTVEVDPAEQAL
ncbi:TRAP transporter small permease [Brachybacterium sacelli]|uniref:TRAP-type C4-dicarboxylate transport system permease small subunit n=1 Tax=Brachybacterium sacelli TaxID=173364 RepID=A0ABS4WZ28_9MICO|nr:TRAP-type C4-dicarboxylate transport system permease small subunit [Brachybacterium sacelli]